MSSASYADKLKDPRWQRRRLEIFERDGFACVMCGECTKTLHVHHHFYRRGAEPWEYDEGELSTLCEGCHSAATIAQDRLRAALCRINPLRLWGLIGHVEGLIAREVFAEGDERVTFAAAPMESGYANSIHGLFDDPSYRINFYCDQVLLEEIPQ